MSTEILTGIIAGIVAIVVAAVGKSGSKDERNNTATAALIDGQSARIDKLETRLDTVEDDLQAARRELHAIQSHAGDLRDALRAALAWIAEVLEHFKAPEHIAPPAAPNVERWQKLIDSPPRARTPPNT